ncbi:NDR1/HIN1-like protein 13 [Vicia villosa]|uniref:NDR1/HIN1-like protein 13 n=1 Tax=Vicia villosa TaxID=3911 RepID=UPI00273B618E|nr:NDR1/HIN1-like protein 13 [Vicia villosa]
MEERASPPPPPPPQYYDSKPQLPDIGHGTYVVQVPKDQIYRIPPPENARIAELHRKPPTKETNRTRCCCIVFIIIFLAIVILIGGVLGGLFSMVLTPTDPKFSIQHFLLQSKPRSQYKITIQAQNPNTNVDILYTEGGDVSLSLKNKKIASGDYPSFSQANLNSTNFDVTLKSSTTKLPKEVEESKKNDKKKVRVTFSLSINVQAQMKLSLLQSGSMTYKVTCRVTVNSLAKTTKVVSQECETKKQ